MKRSSVFIVLVVVGLALAGAVGARLCYQHGFEAGFEAVKEKVDTLTIFRVDTLKMTEYRTIRERVTDTLRIVTEKRDTIILPRTQKEYSDSSFQAWVSGYNPALDSIRVYQKIITQTVTQTVTADLPRLTFGAYAGVGMGYGLIGRSWDVGPQVGVGCIFRF